MNDARELLGLPEGFSRSELLQAYHRKLFEIHPDTAVISPASSGSDTHVVDKRTIDEDASRRVPEIIAARELLEKYLEETPGSSVTTPEPTEPEHAPEPGPKPSGPDFRDPGKEGYDWYRRAVSIYGDALDEYWRERLKWSSLPDDAPALVDFREKLRLAKVLFGRVLDRFPGGMWTPDAVEQIAAINIWLGS